MSNQRGKVIHWRRVKWNGPEITWYRSISFSLSAFIDRTPSHCFTGLLGYSALEMIKNLCFQCTHRLVRIIQCTTDYRWWGHTRKNGSLRVKMWLRKRRVFCWRKKGQGKSLDYAWWIEGCTYGLHRCNSFTMSDWTFWGWSYWAKPKDDLLIRYWQIVNSKRKELF